MRKLGELLGTAEGIDLLESKGVHLNITRFVKLLRPSPRPQLAEALGSDPFDSLVWVGQQIYADYPPSVVSKLLALKSLEDVVGTFGFLLMVDTDRSGSDRLMSRIIWPLAGKEQTVRLASRRYDDAEIRFIPLDTSLIEQSINKLETFIGQTSSELSRDKAQVSIARRRFRELFEVVQSREPRTLGDFNRGLSDILFARHLQFDRPSVRTSDLVRQGMLGEALSMCLNTIDDFVAVFNESINSMIFLGIDPQVRPLDADYLPLHYSCDVDDKRLRMKHLREGLDHFAAATCGCGAEYRFHLGSSTLSLAELSQTDRWSPDVSLPILINDLVGGMVAGKSSALYGLVCNEVLIRVLGRTPVPMLVPSELGEGMVAEPSQNSLLYDYIMQ